MTEHKIDLDRIEDVASKATRGNWHWSGNTDTPGNIRLTAGRLDDLGTIPVERTFTDDQVDDLAEYYDDPANARRYLEAWAYDAEMGAPRTDERLAFVDESTCMYVDAADLAVYAVARNQGLPDDTPSTHPSVYRRDVCALRNPNAEFMATADPDTVLSLVGEAKRSRKIDAVLEDPHAFGFSRDQADTLRAFLSDENQD